MISTFLLLISVFSLQAQPSDLNASFDMTAVKLGVSPENHVLIENNTVDGATWDFSFNGSAHEADLIRAELVGPGLPAPLAISAPLTDQRLNVPLSAFPQTGTYYLTNIRLERNGNHLLFATPQKTKIEVISQILVSRVKVEQLSRQELEKLGHVFNERDYHTVKFQLTLLIQGLSKKVEVPVALPTVQNQVYRPLVLQDPFSEVIVRPTLRMPPVKEEEPEKESGRDTLKPQPVYSFLVIPGELSYLKTQFSVACIVANVAEDGVQAYVSNLKSELLLPNPEAYGFPLEVSGDPRQNVAHPGADGQLGTADDRDLLHPGEEAQVDYVVRGNVAGIYSVYARINGMMDLPQGKVRMNAIAHGRVAVRSAEYTVALEHPDVVSEGEPYDFSFTVTNTGAIPLENFSTRLTEDQLIGVQIISGAAEQTFPDLAPGESHSVAYVMLPAMTGRVASSYFRVTDTLGEPTGAVNFFMGIGQSSERLTPYAFVLPQKLEDYLPEALFQEVRRYGKKIYDFSLDTENSAIANIKKPISTEANDVMQDLAYVGELVATGFDQQRAAMRLLSRYVSASGQREAVDAVRRKILTDNFQLEAQLGSWLATHFQAATPGEILNVIAQENEGGLPYLAAVFDGNIDDITLFNQSGRRLNLQGNHSVPFSSIIELAPQRYLLLSFDSSFRQIEFRGSQIAAHLQTWDGQNHLSYTATGLRDYQTLNFNQDRGQVQVSTPGETPYALDATPIAPFPFEIQDVFQLDYEFLPTADRFGRQVLFLFSKPVDLESLQPLEENLKINGQSVVDAKLVYGGNAMVASARMPLGPYRTITYTINGAQSSDGLPLTTQTTGTVRPSPVYTGVSASGRIFDANGSDLTKARVLLMKTESDYLQNTAYESWETKEGYGPASDLSIYRKQIIAVIKPGIDGRFSIDMIPSLVYDEVLLEADVLLDKTFTLGFLLADGRFQTRTYHPAGVAQEVQTDIAFLYQGSVMGEVRDGAGNPLVGAKVFATNVANSQNAQLIETDHQGRYSFSNLDVGKIQIKALYQNQLGVNVGHLTRENNPLALDIVIDQPRATFSGNVLVRRSDGTTYPLSDAFVGVVVDGSYDAYESYRYGSGWNDHFRYQASDESDGTGFYQIHDSAAGFAHISVYHPRFGYSELKTQLNPGDNGEIPFYFSEGQAGVNGGEVSGRVENTLGEAVGNIKLRMGSSVIYADENGDFYFDDVPLYVETSITALGAFDESVGTLTVYLDEELRSRSGLVLQVHASAIVEGVALDADGQPLAYTPVFVFEENVTDLTDRKKKVAYGLDLDDQMLGTMGSTIMEEEFNDLGLFVPICVPTTITNDVGRFRVRLIWRQDARYGFTAINPSRLAELRNQVIDPDNPYEIVIQNRSQADITVNLLDPAGNPVNGEVTVIYDTPELTNCNRFGAAARWFAEDLDIGVDGTTTMHDINTGYITVLAYSALFGSREFTQEWDGNPSSFTIQFDDITQSVLFGTVYDINAQATAPTGTRIYTYFKDSNFTGAAEGRDDTFFAPIDVKADGSYRYPPLVNTSDKSMPVHMVVYNEHLNLFAESFFQLSNDTLIEKDIFLKKRGNVKIRVFNSDGTPADYAALKVKYRDLDMVFDAAGKRPVVTDRNFFHQITPEQPFIYLSNVPSGAFSVDAVGPNGLQSGKLEYAVPTDGSEIEVAVYLETSSNIRGTFVDLQNQPLSDAEVQLLAMSTSRSESLLESVLTGNTLSDLGRFEFLGFPMGSYHLRGTDPFSALTASKQVTTTPYEPDIDVVLKLAPVFDVSGTLYDPNGLPLVGATIAVRSSDYSQTLYIGTDAQGRYLIEQLRLGSYTLTAEKAAQEGKAESLLVLQEQTISPVIHDLHYQATLDLRVNVQEVDGRPMAHTRFSIYSQNGIQRQGFTNAHGQAHFRNLIPGKYFFESLHPLTRHYVFSTYHLDENQAGTQVETTVTFSGRGAIRGRLTTEQGDPLYLGARISTSYSEPFYSFGKIRNNIGTSVNTDEDGFFYAASLPIGLPITVSAFDPLSLQTTSTVIELSEHGEVYELDLQLQATSHISGQVVYSDGTPAAYASVTVEKPIHRSITTAPDGSFTLRHLLPGTTQLRAEDIDQLRYVQTDINLTFNDVGELEPLENMLLTLSPVGSIEGNLTYQNGDQVTGGYVVLYDENDREQARSVIVASGHYQFNRVTTGNWRLRGFSSNDNFWSDPLNVALTEDGQVLSTDLQMPADELLSGQVLDELGNPLIGAGVELHQYTDNRFQLARYVETNDQGYYVFERLFPGEYRVDAFTQNNDRSASRSLTMSGELLNFDINLEPTASLVGLVQDANLVPFNSGTVRLTQLDNIYETRIENGGQFSFTGLRPFPYDLEVKLLDGFHFETHSGDLAIGNNSISLSTPATYSLTASARLLGGNGRVIGRIHHPDGKIQWLNFDRSGMFVVERLLANTNYTLAFLHDGRRRSFVLAPLTEDTFIETPFEVDYSAPEIQVVAGTGTISLPWQPSLNFSENTPGSQLDSDTIQIWLNQKNITSYFTGNASNRIADFSYYPDGMRVGDNTLRVRVGNDSRAFTTQEFTLTPNQDGTTLQVEVFDLGQRVAAEVWLESQSGTRYSTAVDQPAVITSLPVGTYRVIAGANFRGGSREIIVDGTSLTETIKIPLSDQGSYQGYVVNNDGTPADGATVDLYGNQATTDSNGFYNFDTVAFNNSYRYVTAERNGDIGFSSIDNLQVSGQVIVVDDIVLDAPAQISGTITDGDGLTPVVNATVNLDFAGSLFDQSVTSDASGQYNFAGLQAGTYTLRAYHPTDTRNALTDVYVYAGNTYHVDLDLSPTYDFNGQVLMPDGSPAVAAEVYIKHSSHTPQAPNAITDANGLFSLENLQPGRAYLFIGSADGNYAHYKNLGLTQNIAYELGAFTLAPNNDPVIERFETPLAWDPDFNMLVSFSAVDDFALAQAELILTGDFEYQHVLPINLLKYTGHSFAIHAEESVAEGNIQATLRIYDWFGKVSEVTQTIEIRYDADGPLLSLIAPDPAQSFSEGDPITIEVAASDVNGVALVSLNYQGNQLAQSSAVPHIFQTYVPADTTNLGTVTFDVQASDTLGFQSSMPVTVQVSPTSINSSPVAEVISPIHAIPQPLGMQPALQLPLVAELQDSAGLQSYFWTANGVTLAGGIVLGPTAWIEEIVALPSDLQAAAQLNIHLTVFNVAGVATTTALTLPRIDGDVVTSDLSLTFADPANVNRSLILAGGQHTFDGSHQFKDLILVNGATLTHSRLESHIASDGLDLEITDDLVINYNSHVHADGKGVEPSSARLQTFLNGSFAGLGRDIADISDGYVYGSVVQPFISGSGQSSGGVIRLHAGDLGLAGKITANSTSGSSSGGSIWLEANFHGFGKIEAKGWQGEPSQRGMSYASGGRIALYGDFQGQVHASGGLGAGAGTIYRSIPDNNLADGSHDTLSLANLPGDNVSAATFIPVLSALILDQDFTYTTYTQGSQTFGVLSFTDQSRLLPQTFLGYDFYNLNQPTNRAVVVTQTENSLSLLLPDGFTPPQASETWQLDVTFDAIEIADGAHFNFRDQAVQTPLSVSDAGLGVTAGQDLTSPDISYLASPTLIGNGYFGDVVLNDTMPFTYRGTPTFNTLTVAAGTHYLDGQLQTTTLQVDTGATLAAEIQPGAVVDVQADAIVLEGTISNRGTGIVYDFAHHHGGIGTNNGFNQQTYGSLYTPSHQGRGTTAGGLVQLSFNQMTLNGQVDVRSANQLGTPGAIYLKGNANASLSGTGTLDATVASNHQAGGGRIAVHTDDLSGFNGNMIAYGGELGAGAGTVFIRSLDYPNGKLIVDNNGQVSDPDSTLLPALGTYATGLDLDAANEIAIPGIVPGLAGLYAVWPDGSRHLLGTNDQDHIRAASGNFPQLLANQSISGLHVLDALEVRGGASLYSPDPIELATPVVIEGTGSSIGATQITAPSSSGQFSDGTFVVSDANISQLQLTNADVVVDVALNNLQLIQLDATSTLTYKAPINVQTVTIDGGTLLAATHAEQAFTAQTIDLLNGASWTVAAAENGVAFPLVGHVLGTLNVDSTAKIAIDQIDQLQTTALDWGGQTLHSSSNGGYASVSTYNSLQVGSYFDPKLTTNNIAGVIRLNANTLQLDGRISVSSPSTQKSAGSLRIQAANLSGTGQIDAEPSNKSRGGGRIAIFSDDDSFLDTLTISTAYPNNIAGEATFGSADNYGGAGTLFVKTPADIDGRLIIDQRMDRTDLDMNDKALWTRHKYTGVAGPSKLTLNLDDDDPDPRIVRDLSWTDLPPGLAGLYVRWFDGTQNRDIRILDNNFRQLMLAEDMDAVLPAGTELELVLKLDNITLRNGGNLHFAGIVEVDTLTLEGNLINGIEAYRLLLNQASLDLSQTMFRLHLEDATSLQNQDVNLTQTTWITDAPLTIANLNMQASTVTHSKVIKKSSFEAPFHVAAYLHLTANQVTMDASSQFDVSDRSLYFSGINQAHASAADPATDQVYGSPFHPATYGSKNFGDEAGGRLFLQAQSLSGGSFYANSSTNAAGSIWLDIDTIGTPLKAYANSSANQSGAGRVAVYYGSADPATFDLQALNSSDTSVAPGTVFTKADAQTHGMLSMLGTVDQHGTLALPGFATQTLPTGFVANYDAASNTTSFVLANVALSWFGGQQNYAGYQLVRNGETSNLANIVASIVDDNQSVFTVDGDWSNLAAGETLTPAISLNALASCTDCDWLNADLLLLDSQNPWFVSNPSITPLYDGGVLTGEIFELEVNAQDHLRVRQVEVRFNGQTLTQDTHAQAQFNIQAPTVASDQTFPLEVEIFDDAGNAALYQSNILVKATVEPTYNQELFVDGGFEAGNLNGWTILAGNWLLGSENPQAIEGDAYLEASGSGDFRIYRDLFTTQYASAIDQGLQAFVLNYWNLQKVADSQTTFSVSYRDGLNQSLGSQTLANNSTSGDQFSNWLELSTTLLPPAGTRKMRFEIFGDNYGTFARYLLDGMQLTALPELSNGPNLAISSVSAPASAVIGESFVVQAIVTNQGTQALASATLTLHHDSANWQTPQTIPALAIGESAVLTFTYANNNVTPGLHALRLLISGAAGDVKASDNLVNFDVTFDVGTANFEQQLLSNAGGETAIPDNAWQTVSGTWSQQATSATPRTGTGALVHSGTGSALLQQESNLLAFASSIDQGQQEFVLQGWIRSNKSDSTQALRLEFYDQNMVLLDQQATQFYNPVTWQYHFLSLSATAPMGTRFVRSQLLVNAVASDTATSFDDLLLMALDPTPHSLPQPSAYWAFDQVDLDNTQYHAIAGSAPLQLVTAASSASGLAEEALSFADTGSQVSHTSDNALTPTYSFSAWLNANHFDDTYADWLAKDGGFVFGQLNTKGQPYLDLTDQVGETYRLTFPDRLLSNHWYHVAWTYASDYASLYVNGQLVDQVAVAQPSADPTNALTIGSAAGSSNTFHGRMDEIGLWQSALTEAQILDLFLVGPTGNSRLDFDTTAPAIATPTVAPTYNGALGSAETIAVTFDVDERNPQAINVSMAGEIINASGYGPYSLTLTTPNVSSDTPFDLVINASDASGLNSEWRQSFTILAPDTQAPVVNILSPADGATLVPGAALDVELQVTDNRAIASIQATFDGQTQTYTPDTYTNSQTLTFSWTVPQTAPTEGLLLQVSADDAAGLQGSSQANYSLGALATPKPQAYFTFDDADRQDKVALDIAGLRRSHISDPYGTSYTGQLNQAFRFYNNDLMVIDGDAALDISDNLSLAGWVKVDYIFDQGGVLVYGNNSSVSYGLITLSGNKLGFQVGNNVLESSTISTATWMHVAATFQNGVAKLYINGSLDTEVTWAQTSIPQDASAWLQFAQNQANGGTMFRGYLDEMGIWSETLAAIQINDLYSESQAGQRQDWRGPEAPTNLTIDQVTTDGFQVSWTASANSEGDLAGYRVQLNDQPAVELDAASTNHSFSGLSAETVFSIKVYAVDFALNQGWSAETLAATNATVAQPLTPRNYWTLDSIHSASNYQLLDATGRHKGNFYSFYNNTTAIRGQAGRFTSTSHVVEIPEYRDLWSTQAWTIALWFNSDQFDRPILNYGSSSQEIFAISQQQTPSASLRLNAAGGQSLDVTGGLTRDGNAKQPMQTDTWNYLAVSYDNGQVTVYLNGERVASETWNPSLLTQLEDAYLSLGNTKAKNFNFRGEMDEVMLWHRSLTQHEILQVMQPAKDLLPPAEISNLQVLAQTQTLDLSWTLSSADASDVDHYVVLRDGNPVMTVNAGQNTASLSGLTALTSYQVTVAAVDSAGNRGAGLSQKVSTLPNQISDLPQPVSYWTMDNADMDGFTPVEVIGTHPANYSSQYNNRSGVANQAVQYSSSTHSTEVPAYDTLLAGDTYTLSTWVYITNFSNRAVLSFGDATTSGFELKTLDQEGQKFWLQVGSTTPFEYGAKMAGNNRQLFEQPRNTWLHLTLVSEPGSAHLYCNGEKVGTIAVSAGERPNLVAPWFSLGKNPRNNMTASLYVDETAIWDQALGDAAISILYSTAKAGQPIDLRPPEAVRDLTAMPSSDEIQLNWTASANTQGDLAAYQIVVDGQLHDTLPDTAISYVLTNLNAGTGYDVVVHAVDQNGRISAGAAADVATLPADLTTFPKPILYYSYNPDTMDGLYPENLALGPVATFSSLYSNQAAPFNKGVRYSNASHQTRIPLKDALANGQFSLSTWLRASNFSEYAILAIGSDSDERLGLRTTNDPGGDSLEWFIDHAAQTYLTGFANYSNNHPIAEMNTSDWYHVAVSYDGTTLKLFLNGTLWHEINWTDGLATLGQDAWLALGSRPAFSANPNVYMDETLFWSTALHDDNIAQLYTLGNANQTLDTTPLDLRMPADIGDLQISSQADQLTLTWLPSADEGGDLDGYHVYLDGALVHQAPAGTTTYTLTNLTANTAYDVRVCAVDGNANQSNGITLPAATEPVAGLPDAYAYWSMDERTTSELIDQMQNIVTTYLNSPVYSAGKVGSALRLSSAYRVEFDNITLDPSTGFSMSTWVYLSNITDGGILALGDDTTETFGLVLDGSNGKQFRFSTNSTVSAESVASKVETDPMGQVYDQVEANRWYHLAMRYDGSVASLYVDGVLHDSASWSAQAMPTVSPTKLVFGQHHPGSDTYVTGYMDETVIWTNAVDQATVRNLYLRGRAGERYLPSLAAKRAETITTLADFPIKDGVRYIENTEIAIGDLETSETLVFTNASVRLHGHLKAAGVFFLDHTQIQIDSSAPVSLVAAQIELEAGAEMILGNTSAGSSQLLVRADYLLLDGKLASGKAQESSTLALLVDEIYGSGQIQLGANHHAQVLLVAANATSFEGQVTATAAIDSQVWLVANGGEHIYKLDAYLGRDCDLSQAQTPNLQIDLSMHSDWSYLGQIPDRYGACLWRHISRPQSTRQGDAP